MSQICVGVHQSQQLGLSGAQKLTTSGSISWRSKNPRRSCFYFWRIWRRLRFSSPNLRNRPLVPAATRIKGRSGARIDLSERPRVTSLCCQHQSWALSLSAIIYVLKQMFYLFIFHGVTGVFGFRSFSKQVSQQMNIVKRAASDEFELLGGGGIEDFSSCFAARVERTRL